MFLLYQLTPHPETQVLKTIFKYSLSILNLYSSTKQVIPPFVVSLYPLIGNKSSHQTWGSRGRHALKVAQYNLGGIDTPERYFSWAKKFPGRKIPGSGLPCNDSLSWITSVHSVRQPRMGSKGSSHLRTAKLH